MQVGHRVDEGHPDTSADVGMVGHRRRDRVADDLAVAPVHDHEVGADDVVVVAEQMRTRRPIERPPELRQHTELALHVVGSGRDDAEGRATEDELGGAEPQQIGQVGRPVRELQHLEPAVEPRQVRPEVGLEGRPVELLTGADGCRHVHAASLARRLGLGGNTPARSSRCRPAPAATMTRLSHGRLLLTNALSPHTTAIEAMAATLARRGMPSPAR